MTEKATQSTTRIYNRSEMHWVGDGFPVRSIFGYNDLGQELSPFLLLDYAAPYEFEPGTAKRGVGEHPHRGFETVTIAYQGEIEHRDSSGGGGKIGPGDVQWMTAASGLVHEEFHSSEFTKNGGTFEMIQLWVNLPRKHKSANPGYQTLLNSDIPRVEVAADGKLRVIAGEFKGTKGPAKTFTPINLWDIELAAQTTAELPLPVEHSKSLLVLRGTATINGEKVRTGELVVFGSDVKIAKIEANDNSKFFVLTGEPLNEPIVGYGPFVMNTDAEIQQAFRDYRAGKFGTFEDHA